MTKDQMIEISKQVRDHLITQKKQSKNEDGGCVYRACDGSMCAVGVLIKEDFYNKSFENKLIDDDEVFSAVSNSLGVEEMPWELAEILSGWQQYHDDEYAYYLEGNPEVASPTTKHIELVADILKLAV